MVTPLLPATQPTNRTKTNRYIAISRSSWLAKYYIINPAQYVQYNAAFVLAALLQAWFVARAPGLGVDVNLDGALWGPLYGTWLACLLYALAAALRFDWLSAARVAAGVLNLGFGVVYGFFNGFVWRAEWAHWG